MGTCLVAWGLMTSYSVVMARDTDTAIGGAGRRFPTTPRSAILGVRSDDPVLRARAFTSLVRAYWKPSYKRIRLRWRKTNEEAKDLTQAFFARSLERRVFETYDPDVARFRTFLCRCLDNFVANAHQAETAQKRGGGDVSLRLDFMEAETELARSGRVEAPVDEGAFDKDFVRSLHSVSLDLLRRELTAAGREAALEAFERYDLVDEKPTYDELASALGVKRSDVTNYLHATRKRFRRIVLEQLRNVTLNEEEFRLEARELLGLEPEET